MTYLRPRLHIYVPQFDKRSWLSSTSQWGDFVLYLVPLLQGREVVCFQLIHLVAHIQYGKDV